MSKRHEHFMRGTQKQKNHLKWNAGNGVLHENEVRKSVFSMKVTVFMSKFFPQKEHASAS